MQPFLASRLKIGRAAQHVAILRGEVAAFMLRRPIYLLVEPHPENKELWAWAVRVKEGVPPTWAPIIGDIVHNLRASLDLMACDVVRVANPSAPLENVYFPFAKRLEDLDLIIAKRMALAPPEAQDLVRSMKPFPGGNDVLRGIHELDIVDKHRALLPVAGHLRHPMGGVTPGDLSPGSEPTKGITNPAYRKGLKLGVSPVDFSLVFPQQGPFEGRELIPKLENLVKDFASVVDAFETLSLGTVADPLTDIMPLSTLERPPAGAIVGLVKKL
ncbi:hypothetical protein [Phenylobacterium sp.]|uniref:hypothetical protein n=1 Tax=Phenylobacterium sp. TaxID=1871053 RepID=UPI003D2D2485